MGIENAVSRETLDDLQRYAELILKWTPTINLISRSTLDDVWDRHILDSLQLWPLIQGGNLLCDLGSGGGLPGIVMAICAKHDDKVKTISLIEADLRKSAFLRTCIRELALPATILTRRIEDAPRQNADIVTARALKPLNTLCAMSDLHGHRQTQNLFLKGKSAADEIEEAKQNWRFHADLHASKTDPAATIIELKDLQRA